MPLSAVGSSCMVCDVLLKSLWMMQHPNLTMAHLVATVVKVQKNMKPVNCHISLGVLRM